MVDLILSSPEWFTCIVSYNDVNLRIGSVSWTIQDPARGVHTLIWRMDIDPINPVVDRVDFVDGEETVPGNFNMVEEVDEFGGWSYVGMPPELRLEIRSVAP